MKLIQSSRHLEAEGSGYSHTSLGWLVDDGVILKGRWYRRIQVERNEDTSFPFGQTKFEVFEVHLIEKVQSYTLKSVILNLH